jgi:quinolinate synthase
MQHAATAPVLHGVEPSEEELVRRLERVLPEVEVAAHLPLIREINRLKAERGAVILAHNYQTPEIFHGVADITGDSLALARRAGETEASTIVLCGVHFMAETAKILNPDRTVLIPDASAGCSLAESITAADVRELRRRYPGVPVVTYVNTSAEVKAESDICCTSANAIEVVESLGAPRVLLLPDRFLAAWVDANTEVEVIPWERGACEVHEQFTASLVAEYRATWPDVVVLAHPECRPEVLEAADMAGSTSAMLRFVRERRAKRVALITECSMADNIAAAVPDVEIVRPCTICPHMKKITLEGIRRSLLYGVEEVRVDPTVAGRARAAVERMLAVGRGARG